MPRTTRAASRGDVKTAKSTKDSIPPAAAPKVQSVAASGKFRVTCMSIPVTDRDEEAVECKFCGHKSTFREFRIHSMQEHSNIATTTDDPTEPERKFYERKLRELAKFTKTATFNCPTKDCEVSYKSTLGLAYHLETCGKTQEEIESCLIECDRCNQKMTRPNLAWHKKSHCHPQQSDEDDDDVIAVVQKIPRRKRPNTLKAQKVLKEVAEDLADKTEKISISKRKGKKKAKESDDDEWLSSGETSALDEIGNDDDDDYEIERAKKPRSSNQRIKKPIESANTASNGKNDFNMNATRFINSKAEPETYWEAPTRKKTDIFSDIQNNPWTVGLSVKSLKEYLPKQTESVEFKTEVETTPELTPKIITKDYRKLPWFTGEVVDDEEGNLVFNAGGPVFGLGWHYSGKFLAVSTGSTPQYDVNLKKTKEQKGCIQIYSHHYEKSRSKEKEKKPVLNSLTLQLIICFDYGFATNLQWSSFYPDCCDEFSVQDGKFEKKTQKKSDRFGYVAGSFEDGSIRIFSILAGDVIMKHNIPHSKSSNIPVYKKEAEICLKVDKTVYENLGQVCKLDWHENNRLLVAGYASGVVAIYDLESRSKLLRETVEEDGNKVVTFSPFWVFQAHVDTVTGVHFDPNCPRYFATASKDRFLKIWDTDFRKEVECRKVGLVVETCWIRGWIHVAVAVDASISNMSAHLNFVRFYQIGHSQGRPNVAEFMDISTLSFHNGITVQGTEHGTITTTYFDHFWRECDYDRNKKKHNIVKMCKTTLDTTSFEPIAKEAFPQTDENYAPYLFTQDKEPRINLKFFKERVRSQTLKDASVQYFENYARFFQYVRINKVNWCPIGKYFAVGYRSGLLTIIPASFKSLYE